MPKLLVLLTYNHRYRQGLRQLAIASGDRQKFG